MRAQITLLLIVSAMTSCVCQHLYMKKYGLTDGLPEIEVRWADCSPDGAIWYNTQNYLGRFNGYKHTYWSTTELGVKGISVHGVSSVLDTTYLWANPDVYFKIYQDTVETHHLPDWVYNTRGSTQLIYQGSESYRLYKNGISNTLLTREQLGLKYSTKGTIIIHSKQDTTIIKVGDGVLKSATDKVNCYSIYDGQLKELLPKYRYLNQIQDLIVDKSTETTKIINSKNGVTLYDKPTSNRIALTYNDNRLFIITSEEEHNTILLGTLDGVEKMGIVPSMPMIGCFTDHQENVWIYSHDGLIKINPYMLNITSGNTPNMISSLHTMLQLSNGDIQFGGYGTGLVQMSDYKVTPIELSPSDRQILPGGYVNQQDQSYYFIGSKNPLVTVQNGKVRPLATRATDKLLAGYYILELEDKTFALGLQRRGLGLVDKMEDFQTNMKTIGIPEGLQLTNVLTIAEDSNGNLWCGRSSQGMSMYNVKEDKAYNWPISVDNPESFGAMASLIDSRGTLWLGTNEGIKYLKNIADFDYRNDNLATAAKTIDYISHDPKIMTSMLEVEDYIVCASTYYVYFIPKDDFYNGGSTIYNIPFGDLMPGAGVDQNLMMQDQDGYLWLGTNVGAVRLDLDHLPIDTFTNSISVTHAMSKDLPLEIEDNKLTLPPDHRSLSLDIAIDKNKFAAQSLDLVGLLITTNNDTVRRYDASALTNGIDEYLVPGDYTLALQTYKHNTLQQKELLTISVQKKLVEKSWFWILLVGLFAAMVLFSFLNRIRREKQLLEKDLVINGLKQARNEAKVEAIISSFNPHFINNSLHWVQSKYNDDHETVVLVGRLTKNIQHIFKNTREGNAIHTLKEELQIVENYVAIQLIRFDHSFTYKQPQAEKLARLESFPLTLMQIQIHVENAIEHGLRNRVESTYVTVEIVESDDAVTILIEDDGIGRQAAENMKSHGTQSGVHMLEQLHELYNANNRVPIKQKYTDNIYGTYGTKVEIVLPKNYQYEL